MKKIIFISFCLFQLFGFSQVENTNIFDRISETMKTFEIDTLAAPNDKVTAKIKELRNLKGGFNINEAMDYKIMEAKIKNEITEIEYQKINAFLTQGNGKKWIDNAIIWIYRKQFTYKEIKQLVKFYKTSAGKKMAKDFPIIMIQSQLFRFHFSLP